MIEVANGFAVAALLLLVAAPGCSKRASTDAKVEASAAPAASAVASGRAPPEAPRVPAGYLRARVAGLAPTRSGSAVLLVVDDRKQALPIFIGGTEALSIQLRLRREPFVRPLTHDLMDAALAKLGGRVESIRVDELESSTFVGTVVVVAHGKRHEIDARPSDGIALALGAQAPIFVSAKVLERAGVELDEFPAVEDPPPPPDEPPGVTL